MGDYAETLSGISARGPDLLYGGALGASIAEQMARTDGLIDLRDLRSVRTVECEPVEGAYRGHQVFGPPPPSAGGVHVIQMLNILAGHDIAKLGFGSADAMHLLGEALKIAFADRAAATADPAFVKVPVERLISDDYADERRSAIDMGATRDWPAGVGPMESANTTHVSVADADGNIVASTQTINGLFDARFSFPGTGSIPNNYMRLFDPHPGHALSVAPGKRVTTSMAPTIVTRNGAPAFALGLPGGLRIFGSAMKALVNLIDHGMSLQEAVEAPRLWTQGQELELELEDSLADTPARGELERRGWRILPAPHVGGGMCAIEFGPGGAKEGAACWRADGVAVRLGGGHARAGTRFWPDAPAPDAK